MSISRQARLAVTTLAALSAAVVFVTACDTTSSFTPGTQNWGFVYVSALRSNTGEHRTAPTGSFFKGSLSSIPDARLRTDSCFSAGDYVAPNNGVLTGVTYLDAGQNLTTKLGANSSTIPRVSSGTATVYNLATGTTLPYTPGDSVVVTVPGAAGGYPQSEVRGKSAESFTADAIAPSTATIPLKWSASSDGNSTMIVSLQYTPAGGTKVQEIRCAFTDDGTDSIPLRQHQAWSTSTNTYRAAVFTRLRTSLVAVSGGGLELVSTYNIPTPTP
ncbi:MAG: hypothetical protein IT359_11195 [Gemmatimonadaceae bacterium]|nr:hypothetical protein [Gemmatimonadaceae bacterium]